MAWGHALLIVYSAKVTDAVQWVSVPAIVENGPELQVCMSIRQQSMMINVDDS
jgi:hypothetical protein